MELHNINFVQMQRLLRFNATAVGKAKVPLLHFLLTWTFFKATDVLSSRYLARYTSLNWPRPIFFSIWKFASELWPISGCNGF